MAFYMMKFKLTMQYAGKTVVSWHHADFVLSDRLDAKYANRCSLNFHFWVISEDYSVFFELTGLADFD